MDSLYWAGLGWAGLGWVGEVGWDELASSWPVSHLQLVTFLLLFFSSVHFYFWPCSGASISNGRNKSHSVEGSSCLLLVSHEATRQRQCKCNVR